MRKGAIVRLRGGEINLLEALVRNPSKRLSCERLLALARDDDASERNDRAIDIAVLQLRRVIEADFKQPRWIQMGVRHRLPIFAMICWLRRLLPKSLRAHLILLVLGTVLLAHGATVATALYYQSRFMEDVALDYMVTTIRTLRAAVWQVPAEQRADFVLDALQNQWWLWSRVLLAEAQLQRPWRRADGGKPGWQQGEPERRRPTHSPAHDDNFRQNQRMYVMPQQNLLRLGG